MPQIFDDEGRERVRSLLIENGFTRIIPFVWRKESKGNLIAAVGLFVQYLLEIAKLDVLVDGKMIITMIKAYFYRFGKFCFIVMNNLFK